MKKEIVVSYYAYRVIYYSSCNGDEIIGYFQTETSAEQAKNNFICENKLTIDGLCCSNTNRVKVERIIIQP